jgi:hypothetical protein
LGSYDAGTHTFTTYTSYKVPVGMVVHLAVIAKKDNNYYISIQKDLTVTDNLTKTATMTPLTYAELLTAMNSL